MTSFILPNHRTPADCELFVIGDIHGDAGLLRAALAAVADAPRDQERRSILVLLGDLIDRGQDSLGCLDLAARATEHARVNETVLLAGNHELLLRHGLSTAPPDARRLATSRAFLSSAEAGSLETWVENGGLRGLPPETLLWTLPEVLGPARRALIDGMRSHFVCGSVLCVHAGLNPRLDLDAIFDKEDNARTAPYQSWGWARKAFLDHRPGPEGHFGFFVLHGHSIRRPLGPKREPERCAAEIARARLCLDAGSFLTGAVRLAHVRDDRLSVTTVRAPS
jgi:serine/threonine protein phosphatase 1